MSENIVKPPAGEAAPVGKESERPAPNNKPPVVVSCEKQRGWYEREVKE